ncbi:hypothetical protein SO802_005864 [Lithocarpus litseifolius]|uniref:Formamidopyrimidine-DNA glycosylase catalytic domain-containing protein n=1 Tax=Lithocarpus litseifolius TaxID=425828 RepID=A0AAW2DP03_9ROSI
MPELPEVEAARRAVEEHCLGKKIKKAIIANDTKVIDSVSASDFEAALLGKTLISAHRKGKNLWLHLDSPPFPSFQFGMSGAIYIKGVAVTKYKRSAVNDTDEWPSKYSKFFIELDDGLELSFTDKRRFAKVRLLKDPAAVSPISELGPDALLEPMTVDEFTESLSKKKIAIKALLLDQSYIAGIGNWIADEVLYQARIHPLQSSASMSKENCATLHKCIKEVIEKAIEVGADSSQFPKNWIFHSREKKSGAFVDGKKIDFINAGGRTTAYVPELQKLSGNQAAKVAAEPRKKTSKRKSGGNDDTDEPSNKEEKIVETDQLKKGPKPRGRGKKPPMKRKSDDSDDDEAGDDNSDDDEVQKKTTKKTTTKQAKAEKASKKKVQSSQNSKKPKKAK